MESRHCRLDKRIFFCPVHNASTPCSLQALWIRCIEHLIFISFFRFFFLLNKRARLKKSVHICFYFGGMVLTIGKAREIQFDRPQFKKTPDQRDEKRKWRQLLSHCMLVTSVSYSNAAHKWRHLQPSCTVMTSAVIILHTYDISY